jgi:hypothetical protein
MVGLASYHWQFRRTEMANVDEIYEKTPLILHWTRMLDFTILRES